jgi:2-methylisocitrate lyase-like PEP mutase family enzyme
VHEAAAGRLLVNARIDTYLRKAADPLADALARGRLYVDAGAECVYPMLAPGEDIGVLARELEVPVNAWSPGDGSPTPRELGLAGASRITFGGALAQQAGAAVREMARRLRGS